jgi:hypothetical protein
MFDTLQFVVKVRRVQLLLETVLDSQPFLKAVELFAP